MRRQNDNLSLDIDPILCRTRQYDGFDAVEAIHQCRDTLEKVLLELFELFNQAAPKALETVHEAMNGQLQYVVSSTWREYLHPVQVERVFRKGGLGFVDLCLQSAGRRSCDSQSGLRVDGVAARLERFLQGQLASIVDDLDSGPSFNTALYNRSDPIHRRVVLCEDRFGLRTEQAAPLLQALLRPATGRSDDARNSAFDASHEQYEHRRME